MSGCEKGYEGNKQVNGTQREWGGRWEGAMEKNPLLHHTRHSVRAGAVSPPSDLEVGKGRSPGGAYYGAPSVGMLSSSVVLGCYESEMFFNLAG